MKKRPLSGPFFRCGAGRETAATAATVATASITATASTASVLDIKSRRDAIAMLITTEEYIVGYIQHIIYLFIYKYIFIFISFRVILSLQANESTEKTNNAKTQKTERTKL